MTTRTVLKWWVQLNKTNQVKTAENVKKWKKNFWSYSFSLILFHFVFQNRKKEGRKEKRTHKSKGSIGRGRRWITSFLKCFYFLIYVLHFWLFCFIVHRHLGFDGDANSDYFYNQSPHGNYRHVYNQCSWTLSITITEW